MRSRILVFETRYLTQYLTQYLRRLAVLQTSPIRDGCSETKAAAFVAAKRRRQSPSPTASDPSGLPKVPIPHRFTCRPGCSRAIQRRHDRALSKIGARPLVTSEPLVPLACGLRHPTMSVAATLSGEGISHRCFERPGKGSSRNQFPEYPSDELNAGRQYLLRDWLRRPRDTRRETRS
jgi:hypothetical protein